MVKRGQTFIIERSGMLVASSTGEQLFIRNKNGEMQERMQAKNSQTPVIRATAEYLNHRVGNLAAINSTQNFILEIDGSKQFLQVTPPQR